MVGQLMEEHSLESYLCSCARDRKSKASLPNQTLIHIRNLATFHRTQCVCVCVTHHVYYVDSSSEWILRHDRVQSAWKHICIWLTNKIKLVQHSSKRHGVPITTTTTTTTSCPQKGQGARNGRTQQWHDTIGLVKQNKRTMHSTKASRKNPHFHWKLC